MVSESESGTLKYLALNQSFAASFLTLASRCTKLTKPKSIEYNAVHSNLRNILERK